MKPPTVSGSDSEWGADVLMGNKETVLEGINDARQLLSAIETSIHTEDRTSLVAQLDAVKTFRNQVIKNKQGT